MTITSLPDPAGKRVTTRQRVVPPPESELLFPRVVLGIDFSPASLAAARWATTHVARSAHAILFHVVPYPDDSPEGATNGATAADALRQMTPALTGGLGGFAATLDVADARNLLRFGGPSRWLSTIADDTKAALLVLGRRADANRIGVGEPNVIERTARRTNASVLVVPEGTMHPVQRIVAAVDESPFAPTVHAVARWLARLHQVPLILLHVLSSSVGTYARVVRAARHLSRGKDVHRQRDAERSSMPSALPARVARWLLESADAPRDAGSDRTEIALGDPVREIAAVGTLDAGTLVVAGMRGADGAPTGSLGSVVRELLTRAPFPVLAVSGV